MALSWKRYSSIEEMQADDYKEPCYDQAEVDKAQKEWREMIAETQRQLYPNGYPYQKIQKEKHEPS